VKEAVMVAIIKRGDLDSAMVAEIPEDMEAEVGGWLHDNRSLLIGMPHDIVKLVLSARTDDAYADAQEELYRAMSPAERKTFLEHSVRRLQANVSILLRGQVLLERAWDLLGDLGAKAIIGLLGL